MIYLLFWCWSINYIIRSSQILSLSYLNKYIYSIFFNTYLKLLRTLIFLWYEFNILWWPHESLYLRQLCILMYHYYITTEWFAWEINIKQINQSDTRYLIYFALVQLLDLQQAFFQRLNFLQKNYPPSSIFWLSNFVLIDCISNWNNLPTFWLFVLFLINL